MSYDLYFYKRKSSQLTEKQVADYLTQHLPFNVSTDENQWVYENPETGVYFLIDRNIQDADSANDFDNFKDYAYLNFSFSINFFRPRFFGIEIFPIIEKFIADLDLWVLDPQDETRSDEVVRYESGYLQEQWIRHNDEGIMARFTELRMEYMPLERSNYIWQFQNIRHSLQESIQEDIFVPGIFVLKSKSDGLLYTACVWPQHIPIILPAVDYVIVQKKYKKLFRVHQESGLVSYQTIIGQFGNLFAPFEHTVAGLKVIRPVDALKIEKQFNALKLGPAVKEFGQSIAKDSFVNVRPS